MPKDPSPLLGYNNNIRHKNRVFHVQTEDSGVKHPHIITHLFMDGGRILKSVKTSYAEHVGAEKMGDLVRKMMKDQHKGMLIALREGQFDTVIEGGDAPKEGRARHNTASSAALAATVPQDPPEPVAQIIPAGSSPEVIDAAGTEAFRTAMTAPALDANEVARLERAAAEATSPIFEPPREMAPPPANMFKAKAGGNYSTVGTVADETKPPSSRNQASKSATPPGARAVSIPGSPPGARALQRKSTPPGTAPVGKGSSVPRRPSTTPAKPSESRYAPTRPASIFGQSKPRGGSSIFGEDIISDKSLDEVILSYLAEDDPPPKK